MTEVKPLDRPAVLDHKRAARRRLAKWTRRSVLGVIVIGALGALVYNFLPKPVEVEVAVARRAPLEVTVEEDGKTRVHERFVVAAPISGSLARVELEPGDVVVVGAVIAQIQPPDPALLDPRSRDEATARLSAAVAQERAASTAIARARVGREQAVRDAERTRKLAATGAITLSERERGDLAEQLSSSDLATAQQQAAAAAAAVAVARAVLGQGTRAGAGFAVKSPASGRIFKVVRDSAGAIAAAAPLVELGDPRAIEAVIDVLSSDAARITPGMHCAIGAWGGDGELAGSVTRIEPSAFTHLSALGVEEQRVNVVIAIPDPPATLGDGYRIEGKIVLWAGEALAVPGSAVFRDHDAWAVYTVEDGRAKLVHVEVGRRGRLDVEIVQHLAPGARVILHPGDTVTDGVRVRSPG
ncbi:MAG: efflux RND transporter periplasmic adaptor subunit [Kofleriaceae bacterium]